MRIRRRRFVGLLLQWAGAMGLAMGWPRNASARSRSPHPQIHRATRTPGCEALGVRRPRLSRPPPPFKTYPDAKRIDLVPSASARGESLAAVLTRTSDALGFDAIPIPFAELARLLRLSNGVTAVRQRPKGTLHLRAAPSAGALYSGELYVAAERVAGLTPGLYYYDVIADRLSLIREGQQASQIERALERPFPDAAAYVLLTNVFERYTWRYANRGYRYALIDTGHIGENLRLAAAGANLGVRCERRFHDDRLNEALGIDGASEAVCALYSLGSPAKAAPLPPPTRALAEKQRAEPVLAPADSPVERFHAATKLVEVKARPSSSPDVHGAVSFSFSDPPELSVEEAIRARRSPLAFSEASVKRRSVEFAVAAAGAHPRLHSGEDLELYVFAHRVTGLKAGLYRFQPDEGTLAGLREGQLADPLTSAALGQRHAATCSAAFVVVGRLDASESPLGLRRYRDLLIDAGEIGERIYLAAESEDLAARNLAAFVDDDFNELLGLGGSSRAALHLIVFGHPG